MKHNHMLHQWGDRPQLTAVQIEGLRPVHGSVLICWGIGLKAQGDRAYFLHGLVNRNHAARIGVRRSGAG